MSTLFATPLVSFVKFLDFQTPKMSAVITLKFQQRRLSIERFVQKVQMEQSDLGLHCLPRHV